VGRKPLSVAVQELYEGKVKIVGEDDAIDEVTQAPLDAVTAMDSL
jgi:DNA-directed RNA polymerase subunit K/omega